MISQNVALWYKNCGLDFYLQQWIYLHVKNVLFDFQLAYLHNGLEIFMQFLAKLFTLAAQSVYNNAIEQ